MLLLNLKIRPIEGKVGAYHGELRIHMDEPCLGCPSQRWQDRDITINQRDFFRGFENHKR